ncbi:MAG TPA: M56 family metallopeptidase, partial [Thermoanaerobaculia bacterium]
MSVAGTVEALARASLQGALFIAAVWIVCRLFPRLPASVRCGLWWAACLKLLVGLVWTSPVRLPLLPAADAPAVDSGILYVRNVAAAAASPSPGQVEPPTHRPDLPLPEALVAAWLAGLLIVIARSVRQLRHTRWVVRRSQPVREGWVRSAFAELCERLDLRRPPELLGSEDVRTPQAIGLLRPRVVLPRAGLARLSPPEVAMTLCHELLHLRRGDLWLGWVPALAQRIFFFHPLAALAAREYAIARETACDAQVLRVLGTAPQAYGRLLLRWGVAPRETGLAAAGASPSLQNLKRRLQMLEQTSESRRRLSGWWWLAGVVALAGLVPLQIVAQQQAAEAPEAAVAPEALPAEAPEPAVAPAPAVAAAPGSAAVAPAPAVPAALPTPAVAPSAPPSGGIPGGVAGGIAGGVQGGVEGGIPGGVKGGVPGGTAGGVSGGVAGGVSGGVAGALPAPARAPGALPAPPPRPALAPS